MYYTGKETYRQFLLLLAKYPKIGRYFFTESSHIGNMTTREEEGSIV